MVQIFCKISKSLTHRHKVNIINGTNLLQNCYNESSCFSSYVIFFSELNEMLQNATVL